MTNLSIKDVPEELAEALRARAARHHRSLQGELMAIIEAAVADPADARPPPQPATPHLRVQPFRRGWMTPEQVAAERFAKYPVLEDVPLAVDIIRKERDSR